MKTFDISKCAPAIHSNGNSKDSLVDEWCDFHTVIDEAIAAFPSDSFHSRNHYVKAADGSAEEAMEMRQDMLDALKQVRKVAALMGEHIDSM